MYDINEIKKRYILSNEEFEELYAKVKKVTFFNIKKPNSRPTAIITGGQPGSGKTTGLVVATCKEYENLVVLDMDHYRGFLEKSVEIAKQYPELYQEITGIYASKILERLSKDTINEGYNFILEGTMGKSVYTIDLLQQMKADYRIVAKILAVSREESLFSIFERYLEMKKSIGIGRLTDVESHDIRYANLPKIAGTLENRGIEVEVYERTENIGGLNLLYKTNGSSLCKSVNDAITIGRNRSRNNWKGTANERLSAIKAKLEVLEDNPKVLEQVKEIEYIVKEECKDENER